MKPIEAVLLIVFVLPIVSLSMYFVAAARCMMRAEAQRENSSRDDAWAENHDGMHRGAGRASEGTETGERDV